MTVSTDGPSRAELAWDEAARGYDEYFGPRFAPYLGAAVGALAARRDELPSGRVIVPCVGPGRELRPLARVFSERQIAAMARGQALIDELGEQFVSELPSGPLSHTPEARLLLFARR